ncbi:ATP-binding protein [Saxophila tyrrhenica]|uniref:ATP-binding protein n=1 Tax=Saxophila tyrrhenica TaxID=1690608 RepID=A0AAV9PJ07_9PEZI|nr:ATP-binding protein [Saxophila tyrrhenica]
MKSLLSPASPQARLSYLGISAFIQTRHLSICRRQSSNGEYRRSDFSNQGYTGIYEPGGPTEGPLRTAQTPPQITPTALKAHLDSFVVGQPRAKRILSTAVYNHYQRIQELQRREDEEEERFAQEERRRMAHLQQTRHPVEGREHELRAGIRVPALTRDMPADEDEFPGQPMTVSTEPLNEAGGMAWGQGQSGRGGAQQTPLYDPTPMAIEKSNILLLGPSGVGKTLMAKTLARVLEVPFSMSDCTPFTQAGYIGEDAEVCVQRLLAAANYDVAKAERGIICLDEIDKIATARVSHGKDVSGEGVQQALLKIIEGTTLQIQAKSERGSSSPSASRGGAQQGYPGSPTNSPLSSGGSQQNASGPQKGETYNVKTDNILFICAGAFNGLHKMVLDRISKGSIGFNAPVRASHTSATDSTLHETTLEGDGDEELFHKHVPFYIPPSSSPSDPQDGKVQKKTYNTLDLLQPPDLHRYGLIPELLGRLPVTCALAPLSIPQLVQVLTEPRNALVHQYTHLFSLSGIELRFTTPALHAIAEAAAKMGTGARGLRTVMEGVLGEAMFEGPGSGVRGVVVTEEAAKGKGAVGYFFKGQAGRMADVVDREERAWKERKRLEEGGKVVKEEGVGTFEEYRERVGAAGF